MTIKHMNKLYDLAAELIQNPKPKHTAVGSSETFTIKPVAMNYKFSSDVLAETVRKYEAEIATLRAQVAAGDRLREAMVKLAGGIKRRAFALNQSGDDDFEMLGAHYSGLADEITKVIDASKEVKP